MSSAWSDVQVYDIVNTENGAASVELSCGDVPQDTIGWYKYSPNGWKMIFYYYPRQLNIPPRYSNGYNANNTDMGKSVNSTNLVF